MGKDISPILIIGTQRSGSNLLRLMLNQLPEIEAPHPPHILSTFFPLIHLYGDLSKEGNFGRLIADILEFVRANPVPWKNFRFDANEVFARCNQKNLVEIFKVLYEMKAEAKVARFWCCKSMANVNYIGEIEANGLRPFYIHLVRDGRDVAASFKNAIVGEKHIYYIAKQWKNDQELALSYKERLGAQRIHVLLYEEPIRNPRTALSPILTALKLVWSDTILDYYKSDEAQHTAAAGLMWQKVVKPIDRDNMRHYSEKLTKCDIQIFEQIAGTMLEQFSYPVEGVIEAPLTFSEADLAVFYLENESLKKEARKKYLHDAEVRLSQEAIVQRIKCN